MSEALWIALVGVAGTLLSGLGATYLANKAGEKQRAEMRKHELEDAARVAILEVLVSARRWIESADGPAMMIASRDTVEAIDVYITQQWTNPTDMQPMMDNREALDRAAMHAKLLISDTGVRDELVALLALAHSWAQTAVDQPRSDVELGIGDKVGRLRHWYEFKDTFVASAQRLEAVATAATARSLTG